jgi:hypothetical protein
MSGRAFAWLMILSLVVGGFVLWLPSGPPPVSPAPPRLPAGPPASWVETRSTTFGFSVFAPVVLVPSHAPMGYYDFRARASGCVFSVMGLSQPLSDPTDHRMMNDKLDELQNGFLEGTAGTLVSSQPLEDADRYGREIRFTIPDYEITMDAVSRLVVIKGRVYAVSVSVKPGKLSQDDQERFLDSFHVE